MLAGLSALVLSVLVETPIAHSDNEEISHPDRQ
jgi:hypothetical protein